MPKVSDAHLAARRAQILDAATACFSRDGFHATTLRDICAEAGLSAGAVYGYFQSKVDILEAVFVRYAEQDWTLPDAAADPVGAVRAALGHLPLLIDDPALARDHRLSLMMLGEALREPRLAAAYAELNRRAIDRIADLLRSTGRLPEGADPRALAQVILAAYQGFRGQRMLDPSLDGAAFGRALQAVFDGLVGPPTENKKNG